jgi:hypothetical protein
MSVPGTEEDLVGLPEDGQRYELLEGALVVNPPPGGRRQRVSLRLAGRLDAIVPAGLVSPASSAGLATIR